MTISREAVEAGEDAAWQLLAVACPDLTEGELEDAIPHIAKALAAKDAEIAEAHEATSVLYKTCEKALADIAANDAEIAALRKERDDILADLDTAKSNTGNACEENSHLRQTLDLIREEMLCAQNEMDLIAVIDAALAHDGGRGMEEV
jgi:septal ring factor EnvC (AmiA/AmiB activator)